MDWSSIIALASLLITGGGLVTIVTLKDKKSEAVLENLNRLVESAHLSNDEWQEISKSHEAKEDALEAKIDAKDKKIDELRKRVTELEESNSKLSSKCTYLTMMKCVKIGCTDRKPPFGDTSNNQDKYEKEFEFMKSKHTGDGSAKQ